MAPSAETGKRVGQRQDFAARSISSLAGPDGDPVAKDVRALGRLPPGPNPCLYPLGLHSHHMIYVLLTVLEGPLL